MSVERCYCVTGVLSGAQETAASRGRERLVREQREGLPRGSTRVLHKAVRGQTGLILVGLDPAEKYAAELKAQGRIVTLRRWRPKRALRT